ncbi:MAG: rhodanese-like domain-containing protein [Phycisphaerales bacterium]
MMNSSFVGVLMMFMASFALFALIALGSGCQTGERKVSDRDIESVSVDRADELVGSRSGVLGIGDRRGILLDPRSRTSWEAGHIEAAVHVPLTEIARDQPLLQGVDVVVVYGSDYGDAVAQAAAKRLLAVGFRSVYVLRGGLRAWEQAGRDLAR